MALLEHVLSIWAIPVAVSLVFASYLYSYFITYGHLRDIPAPFGAQFSNLWLLASVRRGERYKAVDNAHRKYGKLVRIQPNHVSIEDDGTAIAAIYGHGNGFLKSYVFVPDPCHQ